MNKHCWRYKKLGEVCDVERGGSPRPIQQYITDSEDGINWIKIGDAQEGSKYITSTKEKIIPEGVKKSRLVHCGDFILSNSMSFGRPYILKVDGCIHDGWLVIRDKHETFIKDYLYYYLSSPTLYRTFTSLAVGGVVNNLNSKLVRNVDVIIPPKEEQEAIVAELDEINETIEALKQQVADLDALAQSTFYTMFGDPVTNEKGWEEKKLGELAIIGTGATPSRTKENIYYNGNIPWVKTTEVHYEDIEDTEEKITAIAVEETNCKIYPEGTILMAMYGQGKTRGQIAKLKIRATTNQACAAIDLSQSSCEIDFIYCHLKLMYEHIRSMARGGNQANLNLNLVNSILIINPPLALQQEFAAKVEAIESTKTELNAQIAEMQTLLASRMDYYFD